MIYANLISLSGLPKLGTVYTQFRCASPDIKLTLKPFNHRAAYYEYEDNLVGTTNRSYTRIEE